MISILLTMLMKEIFWLCNASLFALSSQGQTPKWIVRLKSQKSFLNENKHMQGWNPQEPAKQNGNDTTTHFYTIPTSCAILQTMLCVC